MMCHAVVLQLYLAPLMVTHTAQEKQKAYRKLLREWHPDKNPEKAPRLRFDETQALRKASVETFLAHDHS